MVAWWAAKSASCSLGGMGVRPPTRVTITDCTRSGTVSSTPNAAAAATKEVTPGTISQAMPWRSSTAICSSTAPKMLGSPVWTRAMSLPSAAAANYEVADLLQSEAGAAVDGRAGLRQRGDLRVDQGVGVDDDVRLANEARLPLL